MSTLPSTLLGVSQVSLFPSSHMSAGSIRNFCEAYNLGVQLVPFWPHFFSPLSSLERFRAKLCDVPVMSFEGPWSYDSFLKRFRDKRSDGWTTWLNDILFGLPGNLDHKVNRLHEVFPEALEIDTRSGRGASEIGRYTDLTNLPKDQPLVLDSWHLLENLGDGDVLSVSERTFFDKVEEILENCQIEMVHLQTRDDNFLSQFLERSRGYLQGFLERVHEYNPEMRIIIELPPFKILRHSDIIEKTRKVMGH